MIYNNPSPSDDALDAMKYASQTGDIEEFYRLKLYKEMQDRNLKMQNIWRDESAKGASLGTNITWTNLGTTTDSQWSVKEEEKEKELDKRRQVKIFATFAKMFVERFPNWELRPDSDDPFHKLAVAHKNGKYGIISGYPNNEVILKGVETENSMRVEKFSKKHGIPRSIFGTKDATVPFQVFYGWATGIEDDLPSWVRE